MPAKTKKAQSRHRNNRADRANLRNRFQSLRYMVLFMAVLGGLAGGLSHQSDAVRTLAYATNINHNGLLISTNQNRSSNGLASLTLNGQLNTAAQNKANDMVAKDYWSHVSPDGTQPWDFIVGAGYSYSTAGENLAYGALTSEQTVQAWMNSPGHRANILNVNFTQVGFGFANSAYYQGSGPQTVVVAMYATPYGAQAPAPPPPPAPAPAPTPTPAPQPVQQQSQPAPSSASPPPVDQAPVDEDTSQSAEVADDEKQSKPEEEDQEAGALPTKIDKDGNATLASTEQSQPIRRISLIAGNYTTIVVAATVLVGIISAGTLLYRHSKAWHKLVLKGEDFIIHHPVIDAAAVMMLITVIVLLQSVGRVL